MRLAAFIILIQSHFLFGQTDTPRLRGIDSLNTLASLQWVKDSLTIHAWGDSLKAKVHTRFSADSSLLKKKIDSLSSLNLSAEPYASRMDSLLNKRNTLLQEVTTRQEALLNKTKTRLNGWKQKLQTRLDSLGINSSGLDAHLPGGQLTLPEVDLPELPALEAPDFADLNLSPDLQILNQDLGFGSIEGLQAVQNNLSGLTDKVAGLKELSSNPLGSIENAAVRIDEVAELQKQKELMDAMQLSANPAGDLPSVNSPHVQEQLVEKAVDHFAGKEDQLKQAMEKVATYKQKYPSVQSLSDLAKRPPNPMKDKPFVERLVPGLALQYQRKNDHLLDINLYSGYRFTGRLTGGAGWNYRLARDAYWNHRAYIYGPRFFGNFELGRGFIVHLETEVMNAFVPVTPTDPVNGQRQWVWGMMTGMKKTYKITRNLRGTFFALYNIFDPQHKSPYVDRWNMRMGFEYTLKKRKKKPVETPQAE